MTKQSAPGATRTSACGTKVGFATESQAQAAMKAVKARKGLPLAFAVYRCRFCGKFHWGNARKGGGTAGRRTLDAIDRALAADAARRSTSGRPPW